MPEPQPRESNSREWRVQVAYDNGTRAVEWCDSLEDCLLVMDVYWERDRRFGIGLKSISTEYREVGPWQGERTYAKPVTR